MSEAEKFLDRWARRKRDAADLPAADLPAPAEAKEAAKTPPPPDGETAAAPAEGPFDPASLPPIESITAQSDVRAFLKPGVPPELTRAAFRRAWSADPAIRDFIGLVENGWNFNDPYGVPGFGPMPMGENIGRLLAQAIGAPPPETAAPAQATGEQGNPAEAPRPANLVAQSSQDQPAPAKDDLATQKETSQSSEDHAALQNGSDDRENVPPSRPHGHGGALPK